MLRNGGLRIYATKCLYEGVIVPTALYRAQATGMTSAERRKVNDLATKCLRNLVGVSLMYIELGIRRCAEQLKQKGSCLVEWIREIEYCDGLSKWREWMSIVF